MNGVKLTYSNTDLVKYSVSEYLLSLPSKNTRQTYASNLYNYFRFLHPNQINGRRLRGRKDIEFAKKVDQLSIEYVYNPQRYKADINRYRDHISNYAPKSRRTMITTIFGFLGYNEITFSPNYKKNIYGKEKDAISEEYIPNSTDIKKICEFLSLPEKP